MKTKKSASLMKKAQKIIPGGVNSPVRAFKAVGGNPLFIKKAKGSKIVDADGNSYIDYIGSWGPMILGHAHKGVTSAIKKAAKNGTSYGAPTSLEVELAEMLIKAVPSMEMVRLVSSGTEATMSAIRVARAFTGRDGILKFEGCYHGHADSLLVKAGSGAATLGVPDSPGVPKDLAKHTFNARFNDIDSVEKILKEAPGGIACVIVEGAPGNMGVVPPKPGFMKALKSVAAKYGALLIMDEVMSGFRLCYGGAQKIYGIKPDLTCMGKVIGGGLPVGAFGGRRDVMSLLAPLGATYQAGTLSGNPLAMSAGIRMLEELKRPGVYSRIMKTTDKICKGLEALIKKHKVECTLQRAGSMFTLFFGKGPIESWDDAAKCDREKFGKFFRAMLNEGVYLPPSQFEAAFVGLSHSDEDVKKTLRAADKAFASL